MMMTIHTETQAMDVEVDMVDQVDLVDQVDMVDQEDREVVEDHLTTQEDLEADPAITMDLHENITEW